GPSAAGHGVFFQSTQTRRGLPRVKNLRVSAFDGVDELRGQRGDAGETLSEIERDAFGAEDGARIAGNAQQNFAALCMSSVLDQGLNLDIRRKLTKYRFGERKPGHN